MRLTRIILFGVVALVCTACVTSRTLLIDSSQPARIGDNSGCQICATTPCAYAVSRETCAGFDSSAGYVTLTAVLPNGKSMSLALRTCAVEQNQRVYFDFEHGPTKENALLPRICK